MEEWKVAVDNALDRHETDIEYLKKKQESIDGEIKGLRDDVRESRIRSEEQNKYLREQNEKILAEILNVNKYKAAIEYNKFKDDKELEKLQVDNKWRFRLKLIGGSSVVTVVLLKLLDLLLKQFGGI